MAKMQRVDVSPRIVRRESPSNYGNNYRKTRPYLRRDFGRRCAYCLVHDEEIGEGFFVIDHFLPRARGGTHDYANLYYACMVCNSIKHDTWPSTEEHADGIGFCDPCQEWDYGVHFVESPQSGELSQETVKGDYHIDKLRLNRVELIEKRRYRNELIALVETVKKAMNHGNLSNADADKLRDKLSRIERQITLHIPLIRPRIRRH